jgi:hypothetical protein
MEKSGTTVSGAALSLISIMLNHARGGGLQNLSVKKQVRDEDQSLN